MFDNDYKHPVVLAKEMATIDVLSGGRVELGLGAGWMNTDYEQSGIPYDRPACGSTAWRRRIAVLKGLFADGPFTFEGEHYTITGLDGLPKPVQSPHPPFLIGGGGKRVLSHRRPRGRHRRHQPDDAQRAVDADAARTRHWPPPPTRSSPGSRTRPATATTTSRSTACTFACIVTDDRDGARREDGAGCSASPSERSPDVPHALIGSVDQICERPRGPARALATPPTSSSSSDAMDSIAPVVARLAGT